MDFLWWTMDTCLMEIEYYKTFGGEHRPQSCVESPNRGRQSIKALAWGAACSQEAGSREGGGSWRGQAGSQGVAAGVGQEGVFGSQQRSNWLAWERWKYVQVVKESGQGILWWINKKKATNFGGQPCYKILIQSDQMETWSIIFWKYAELVWDEQGCRNDCSKVGAEHS